MALASKEGWRNSGKGNVFPRGNVFPSTNRGKICSRPLNVYGQINKWKYKKTLEGGE